MSTIKNRIMDFFHQSMLNCEETALLSTKETIEGVNLGKKLQLFLHLLHCHACRNYRKQVKLLYSTLKLMNHASMQIRHRLSLSRKSDLQKIILDKIENS